MQPRIPLYVLTGFLGSGKTTLLNQLVKTPVFANSLVIINELGSTSLDHLLMTHSQEEQVVELASGCICCTIRSDLSKTLRDIGWRFARQGRKQFDRVLIETTGLANPTPVLHTLMADPNIADQYRLQGVVSCVDSVNGLSTLKEHSEARQQAAVADLLLLTKQDLPQAHSVAELTAALRPLNPLAHIALAEQGLADWKLIEQLDHAEPVQSETPLHQWLSFTPAAASPARLTPEQQLNAHGDAIQAYSFELAEPIPMHKFELWLNALLAHQGPDLLRMKAILHIQGFPGPMVVHGVQHLFHPAAFLTQWPNSDRHSKLVFITRNIPRELLEQSVQQLQPSSEG
ncbi:GTP-binding protein [Rheinheimera sp.]|uniref:CobW family GTP-binding protein n=1 Tax=Rheinheimera sp. TaxID=1869214 RepID=UPI00307E41A1